MKFQRILTIVCVLLFQRVIAINSRENITTDGVTDYPDSDAAKYKYEIKKFEVPVSYLN